MLVTTIVLINLLIAMMSDTYQRIQVLIITSKLCIIHLYAATIGHGMEVWSGKAYHVIITFSNSRFVSLLSKFRSMSKTDMAPSPINLFTSWLPYLRKFLKKGTGSSAE